MMVMLLKLMLLMMLVMMLLLMMMQLNSTLAGAAPLFNQKETQDITTIRLEGMYTWKYGIYLDNSNQCWQK